jgi:hypothetical protein
MPRRPWRPGHSQFMLLLLQWLYVHCGRSLFPLLNVKANSLTLIQRLEAFALNGAEVDKHIPSFIIFDEAKPFFLVKPFYFTFCQSVAPPFPRFFLAASLPCNHKKTTPFQEPLLKRWWLAFSAKKVYATFPYPAAYIISSDPTIQYIMSPWRMVPTNTVFLKKQALFIKILLKSSVIDKG